MIALLGSAILAFGLYNIHALSQVTEGGGLGLTLLLHHWFDISPAVSGFVFNALCYILGFRVMGRDYEAAVMCSALCGFGMGATPNAMANMQVLTKRYGPAPQAYFIVPLVGSLFADFFNGIIITVFLNVLPMFG